MTAVIAASPALQKWITAPMQSGKEGVDAGPEVVLLALELWTTLPPAVRAACTALPAAGADEVNADAGKKKAKKGGAETAAAEAKRW